MANQGTAKDLNTTLIEFLAIKNNDLTQNKLIKVLNIEANIETRALMTLTQKLLEIGEGLLRRAAATSILIGNNSVTESCMIRALETVQTMKSKPLETSQTWDECDW